MGSFAAIEQDYFNFKTGSYCTHMPYKGNGQSINDTVRGNNQLVIEVPDPLIAHIKNRELISLGASSPNRLKSIPDIPIFSELVHKDIVLDKYSKTCEMA